MNYFAFNQELVTEKVKQIEATVASLSAQILIRHQTRLSLWPDAFKRILLLRCLCACLLFICLVKLDMNKNHPKTISTDKQTRGHRLGT